MPLAFSDGTCVFCEEGLLTLSDVMGTGHHAAVVTKVGPGSSVAVSATAPSASAT